MHNIITLKNVKKEYVNDSVSFMALKGIDLNIERGGITAVVGKSGSGKSTLMNILTGIDKPTCGEITVNNTKINNLSEKKTAMWRGKNIGVVFQFFQLMPTLTILENVMLPMDFCNVHSKKARIEKGMELLKKTGIDGHAHKLPSALSGGQQQRAAIARALANNPPLIVADEPTGNLDSATADDMYTLFRTLVNEGKTLVIVSHDKEISKISNRVITISDGLITGEA